MLKADHDGRPGFDEWWNNVKPKHVLTASDYGSFDEALESAATLKRRVRVLVEEAMREFEGKANNPRVKGARRCTNPACEYGGRWVVGKMVVLRNGRFLCRGRGCHTVYDTREVIDPENDEYRLWVSRR